MIYFLFKTFLISQLVFLEGIIFKDNIMCNSVKNLEIKMDDPKKLDPDVKKVILILKEIKNINNKLSNNDNKLDEKDRSFLVHQH
jgi:hypothetical protein